METVQLYMSGILKSHEAVDRLRYSKINNQVSFHTPRALEYLYFEYREGDMLMISNKYFFNGKDITMNLCIQIRDVITLSKKTTGMNFPEATVAFTTLRLTNLPKTLKIHFGQSLRLYCRLLL